MTLDPTHAGGLGRKWNSGKGGRAEGERERDWGGMWRKLMQGRIRKVRLYVRRGRRRREKEIGKKRRIEGKAERRDKEGR